MTNVKIASAGERIENRQASGVIQYAGEEGDVVGINPDGDLIQADAAAASAQPARGVLLGGAKDPANYGQDFDETRLVVEANYDLVGEDRLAYFEYGVRVRNKDEDWGFTPNEPVYLDKGGGFTQDLSTHGAGDLRQIIGYAKRGAQSDGVGVANEVVINVQEAEEIKRGEAALDGDSTNGKTVFTIPINQSEVPSEVSVTPASADAAGDHYVSNVTASNIEVTYASAPADGTGNVVLKWAAFE